MNTISVKNYRSIKESPVVELKPITVFLGRNSVGKSSLIRLLPLLKQTVEMRTSEPLLWFGDYVDFGDFAQTVFRKDSNDSIVISFSLNVIKENYYIFTKNNKPVEVSVELIINKNNINKYVIRFCDQSIEVKLSENNNAIIVINGEIVSFGDTSVFAFRQDRNLLPNIIWKSSKDDFYFGQPYLEDRRNKLTKYVYDGEKLKNLMDNQGTIEIIPPIISKDELLNEFKKNNPTKFEKKSIKDKTFMKYNNIFLSIRIRDIIEIINYYISLDMQQTSYIKPIRARIDRYYRVQGLRIDELDADGSNLPMIMKSMSNAELNKFEKWSKEKFGVVFSVESSEGHISMVIKSDINGKDSTNLADTGYGYSQMLPIVMLLWRIHDKKNIRSMMSNGEQTVVIEQPELHLHPAFQAKMMDVFVNIIKEAKSQGIILKILFETHSETMINRIGALIEAKQIEQEDVNILVFEKKNDITTISSNKFNSKGLLVGWPTDFFSSEG